MDANTQRVIQGLITLWEDIWFVTGGSIVSKALKPLVCDTLREPGSFIEKAIASMPDNARWFISYANLPVGKRRKATSESLTRKEGKQLAWLLKRGLPLLAISCRSEGITAAEAERRLIQQYEDALSTITLKELVKADDSVTYDNAVRNLMGGFGFSTGSVTGADKRLNYVLEKRLTQESHFVGPATDNVTITTYEQDLKVALWECAKGGNKHLTYEMLRMFMGEGNQPKPIEEQIALIVRIFRGQEHDLMRDTLLRIMRKTIADLPEIRQGVRQLDKQNEALSENITSSGDLSSPSATDLLEHIGISRDNTSENEWQTFMMLSQKILDGELEVGSKTGLSISTVLGQDAARVRKVISRYRERQANH